MEKLNSIYSQWVVNISESPSPMMRMAHSRARDGEVYLPLSVVVTWGSLSPVSRTVSPPSTVMAACQVGRAVGKS